LTIATTKTGEAVGASVLGASVPGASVLGTSAPSSLLLQAARVKAAATAKAPRRRNLLVVFMNPPFFNADCSALL